VPPDLPCLIGEMNTIAKRFKPYAVHFNTTVCSRCYAELARLKIVSFGGAGFSEEFRQQLKPYNYAEGISATLMAKRFANWWCNQMTSKGGSGRTAIFAGGQNPQQDFRNKPRELGVVSTDDPDNKGVVKDVLYPELAKCGEKVTHEYFYEQNVSTAEQQSQAGTAVMNSPQNPATSVVCFCDPVAPQFSYSAAARNNYWPEALFASNQGLDTDATGQTYMDSGGNPSLACPFPTRGCSFDGAIGLGEEASTRPPDQLAGVKIFKASGKTASGGLTPLVQENFWSNYNMLASLIQVTGPNLTPATMAASAPKLGTRGGGATGFPRRAFENGEQSWTRTCGCCTGARSRPAPSTASGVRSCRSVRGWRPSRRSSSRQRRRRTSAPDVTVLREVAPVSGPAAAARRAASALTASGRGRGPLRYAVVAVAYLLFMNVVVGLSTGNILNGIALGSLYGIVGVALVLVYRTNRIINFAAAALGAVPGITALLLVTNRDWNYLVAMPVAIVGGLLVGALTDIVVMRRFANSPRLIATVVTIGLAQTYGILGFFIPIWFGQRADTPPLVRTPWQSLALENSRGRARSRRQPGLRVRRRPAAHLRADAVLRAQPHGHGGARVAENAERAALLGVPRQEGRDRSRGRLPASWPASRSSRRRR
jgi:hypothetical protein